MQIDKEKLLEWLELRTLENVFGNDNLNVMRTNIYSGVITAIERGDFDIKEDTDHADRG